LNKRRNLLVALGAGALTAPFGSFAQQKGKVWRIGLLNESESSVYFARTNLFKEGMRELGYVEGRDYSIEQRSADGDIARLPVLAAELLALKVDLILTSGTPPAVAARKVTSVIPILFALAGDPVGSGLATALSRPGGNVTGLANGVASELITKRLDLLRQMLPGMRRVGILYLADNAANTAGLKQFEADCSKLRLTSIRAPVRAAQEIPAAFVALKHDKAQALLVTQANTFTASRDSIVENAGKHRLPAIYPVSLFAEAGGLTSYGSNPNDSWRRAAAYADKIFKGAKPGDLPIEQPTKFEFVLNLKTAKALGIKIPGSVVVQATKVIE
jgi:putative ABC transport system substrate-binding protein